MTSNNRQQNNSTITTPLRGKQLLNEPLLNKGTAFTANERKDLGLDGLLPPRIKTIDEQVVLSYEEYSSFEKPINKHIFLRDLQDRNEILFYRLIANHITEMMPIIYTPVVGEACMQFSNIYRQPRGLFISYQQQDMIADVLNNAPRKDVKVIVVTDGERILGLGDQGFGGMGIPIGKLALYTACGGINPANTLPIFLDVGTNNQTLLNDPNYLGWRHARITGDDYFAFIDKFIDAIKKAFPDILLQFEDFAQQHATPLLQKYRDQLCTFNDDIQGTAAVTAAVIIAAVKVAGKKLSDQTITVLGGGTAGCGISEQVVQAMIAEGLTEQQAYQRIYLVDRYGLFNTTMKNLLPFQQPFRQDSDHLMKWSVADSSNITLNDVINNAKPTILLGVSGQPGLFSEEIVRAMAAYTEHPIIMPMSNPTSRCEAQPQNLIEWTNGKALIATGSPFADVKFQGQNYPIAQSNNCYIFPGLGLGVVASGAKHISDKMLMQATFALANMAPALQGTGKQLLPDLADIRDVSRHIALAVAKQAGAEGLADKKSDSELNDLINETWWEPGYSEIRG